MADKTRVLLIDDDPDFIEANSIILEAKGFEVLTALSGASGFEMVKKENPDVVVLDVMMEQTDEGFAISRRIRQELKNDVPIVMLTSVGKVTGYEFAQEATPDFFPVNIFLEKPVSPDVLIQKIKEVLAKGDQ